jgi:hypothetical protein
VEFSVGSSEGRSADDTHVHVPSILDEHSGLDADMHASASFEDLSPASPLLLLLLASEMGKRRRISLSSGDRRRNQKRLNMRESRARVKLVRGLLI